MADVESGPRREGEPGTVDRSRKCAKPAPHFAIVSGNGRPPARVDPVGRVRRGAGIEAIYGREQTHWRRSAPDRSHFSRGSKPPSTLGAGSKPLFPRIEAIGPGGSGDSRSARAY